MCGPASMKMVMDYYGVVRSEKHWAMLTANRIDRKTGKINLFYGCSERKMVEAAKDFGFKGVVKQNSSIKELRKYIKKGIPVLVNWNSPTQGSHFSVAIGFDKDKIILADPEFGKMTKWKAVDFIDRWYDFLGSPCTKNLLLRGVVIIHQ